VPLFALIWWLEGRGLSRQPGGWGALVGPGLFCLLVVANADSGAEGWAIAGGMAIGLAVTGFMVTGRRRCA